MRHTETRQKSPDQSSGHFFSPPLAPLATSPLILPSPLWGEEEAQS